MSPLAVSGWPHTPIRHPLECSGRRGNSSLPVIKAWVAVQTHCCPTLGRSFWKVIEASSRSQSLTVAHTYADSLWAELRQHQLI